MSQSQTAQKIPQGPVIQRFTNRRIMHCSLCRQAGHTKGKCPTNNATGDEETESRRVEAGDPTSGKKKATTGLMKKPTCGPMKKKSAKELKRQKLQVRRKGKGIAIADVDE